MDKPPSCFTTSRLYQWPSTSSLRIKFMSDAILIFIIAAHWVTVFWNICNTGSYKLWLVPDKNTDMWMVQLSHLECWISQDCVEPQCLMMTGEWSEKQCLLDHLCYQPDQVSGVWLTVTSTPETTFLLQSAALGTQHCSGGGTDLEHEIKDISD